MSDYDGIEIYGKVQAPYGGIVPSTYGSTFMFFKVSAQNLGATLSYGFPGEPKTPSELIQLWFGDSLSRSDDGLSGEAMDRLEDVAGFLDSDRDADADGLTTMEKFEEIQAWRATSTTAYMVTAVIGNLPPISTGTYGISGFLDWSQSWGLVYDADVLYKNMDGDDVIGLFNTPSEAAIDASMVNSMSGRGWIVAGPDSLSEFSEDLTSDSVWPKSGYAGLRAWYDDPDTFVDALTGFGSGQNRPMTYATYGIEAIGYDAYDHLGLVYDSDYGVDGAWATIDANEALHSNELYRFAPPAASEEVMHAPGILTAVPLGWSPGTFYISWTYPPELHQTFAGAYHATRDDGDSYTYADSDNPWIKTHEQETIDMNSTIDEVCRLIGPTLETTEFPKRLINHIQRKRKIPNNLVSAFGYVPEEMYTAGAVDSYVLGEDDKISYDPVTGEAMSSDASFGSYRTEIDPITGKPMFIWEGESRGVEVGWDPEDTTGGAGEADTESSDSGRYEGWDD